MLKKRKLFLAALLTCLLLGNTFGSVAVKAAGTLDSQAAQTVETMSKTNIFRGPNAFQVNRGRIRDLTH